MRILFITNLFPPAVIGGFELECSQTASLLASWGHEVYILTSDYKCNSSSQKFPFPIKRSLKLFLPFEKPPTSSLRFKKWKIGKHNYAEAILAIEEFKPDVVFFWSPLRIGVMPARAAMEKGIPIVWKIGDEVLAGFVPSPLKLTPIGFYRWLFDHVIWRSNTIKGINFTYASCISETTKKNLLKNGVPLDKAVIIHKGIIIKQFPMKDNPGSLSEPIRLLYVGRLHPEKGVDTLIKAVNKAAKKSSQVLTLTIIGTGAENYCNELKNIADQGKAVVNFVGFMPFDQLSSIYQSHDIFIFPTFGEEGQGSSYLEAMASGLPVIATNHGGHGELLFDGKNALIFPKGNVEALSNQILNLINDESLRKKLSEEGRRYVEKNLILDQTVRSLEKLLYEAYSKKKLN